MKLLMQKSQVHRGALGKSRISVTENCFTSYKTQQSMKTCINVIILQKSGVESLLFLLAITNNQMKNDDNGSSQKVGLQRTWPTNEPSPSNLVVSLILSG